MLSPFLELFDLNDIFDSEKSLLAHLTTSFLETKTDDNSIEDNINKFINDVNEKLKIVDHINDCREVIQTVFSLINNYKKQVF